MSTSAERIQQVKPYAGFRHSTRLDRTTCRAFQDRNVTCTLFVRRPARVTRAPWLNLLPIRLVRPA
jgi:hypothetical protein